MSQSDTLKTTRERLGISQNQLAKQAGIPRQTLARIEAGQEPTVSQWSALVKVMDKGGPAAKVADFLEVWGQ
jgi:predicted transcriptional regulator